MALIELRDVHKRFGRLVVLDGVTLRVEEGESLVDHRRQRHAARA